MDDDGGSAVKEERGRDVKRRAVKSREEDISRTVELRGREGAATALAR